MYKNDGKAILCKNTYDTCFGYGPLIGIYGNPFKGKILYSYNNNESYDFNKNEFPLFLSESAEYLAEFEVFQIMY